MTATTIATTTTTDGVAEAEAALDRLRDRMAAGQRVPQATWEKAEAALRFATARREAGERGERERAERGRLERIASLTGAIAADLDPAQIAAARADLEAALDRFVGVCGAHDRRFADAMDALRDETLAPLPDGLGVDGWASRHLVAGGRTYRRAPTQRTIREAATEAIKRHYPRQTIDLNRPQD